MKRCIAALLLCLLLAGCGAPPLLETTPVVLPTPALPTEAMTPTAEDPPAVPEFVFSNGPVPRAEQDADGQWQIVGPAGSVQPAGYYCAASAWGDVDKDGQLELVYLAPGRTSGIRTQELYVYGLEYGWPVCKGAATIVLNGSVVGYENWNLLVEENSQVVYRYEQSERSEQYGYTRASTTLLPVRLEDGIIRLDGDGELPEGLDCVSEPPVFGASLSALTARVHGDVFLQYPSCLVWRKTLDVPEGEDALFPETVVSAAVSNNGVTVTGWLSWWPQEDGGVTCCAEGVEPVPAQEDCEALAGLSFDELQSELGTYHADVGMFLPSWFTADGKLITSGGDTARSVYVLDLLSGESTYYGQKPSLQLADADTVTILIQSADNSPSVLNRERWNAFLERTGKGEPDALQLRFNADPGADELLSYNGTVYTLSDQSGTQRYGHLIADLELVERDAASPTQAAYDSAIHYLLSDDPEMTMERYFRHIASSILDPDFPRTRLLFSIYLNIEEIEPGFLKN